MAKRGIHRSPHALLKVFFALEKTLLLDTLSSWKLLQHLVGHTHTHPHTPPHPPSLTIAPLLFPRTAFSLFEELSSTPSTPQPERVGKLGVGKRGCFVHHGSSKTVGSKLFSVCQVSARLQSGLMREADNGTSLAGRWGSESCWLTLS